MAEPRRGRLAAHAHRILERLTVVKARIGLLRRRARQGTPLDPREAGAHLDEVDRQVDEAVGMVEELRARSVEPTRGSGSG